MNNHGVKDESEGRTRHLYPPIAKFEMEDGGDCWRFKDVEGFSPYHCDPYVYRMYEFNGRTYLCVWTYDEGSRTLTGRDGLNQPLDIPKRKQLRGW